MTVPPAIATTMHDQGPLDFDEHHSLGDQSVPEVVSALAAGSEPELIWRNEIGGLTFRVGDRFVKWNPRGNGIDLDRERVRLDWISSRHPAPRVVGAGADASSQWWSFAFGRGVRVREG